MSIHFLTTEQVIKIQRDTLPNSGSPNLNKLEGALGRIQTLNYYEGCSDLFTLAAKYLIALTKAHAFNDANKRTAFQATSIFLLQNGFKLKRSPELIKLTVLSAESDLELLNETACALKLLSNYKNEIFDFLIDDLKMKTSVELILMTITSLDELKQKELDVQLLASNVLNIFSQLDDELNFANIEKKPSIELMKLYLLSLDINKNIKRDVGLNEVTFILKLLFKLNDDLDELQPGY